MAMFPFSVTTSVDWKKYLRAGQEEKPKCS
jgi:hypothetical protein